MVEKSQIKHQSFVLFWLGLLTGALLILAFYGMSNGDLEGRLRRESPTMYQAPFEYSSPEGVGYSSPTGGNFRLQQPLKDVGYSSPAGGNFKLQSPSSYDFSYVSPEGVQFISPKYLKTDFFMDGMGQ